MAKSHAIQQWTSNINLSQLVWDMPKGTLVVTLTWTAQEKGTKPATDYAVVILTAEGLGRAQACGMVGIPEVEASIAKDGKLMIKPIAIQGSTIPRALNWWDAATGSDCPAQNAQEGAEKFLRELHQAEATMVKLNMTAYTDQDM